MEIWQPTGYPSIDKPWEKAFPHVNYSGYNASLARRTAWELIEPQLMKEPKSVAIEYYGRIITNQEFYENVINAASAYRNLGIKSSDIVFILGLNTPEIFYTMYALNIIGAVSEWFNPLAISVELLHNQIIENGIEYIFAVDVMYSVIREAIKGTGVKCIVIDSVQISFPTQMRLLYRAEVFGLHFLSKCKTISKSLSPILKKEKIALKSCYYVDKNRDNRCMSWNDFIERYSDSKYISRCYEHNKTTFIVHTGGTTGPVKRIEHTDYAVNSAVLQAKYVSVGLHEGMRSLHVIPPIVALGLENFHLERLLNMHTVLISTYDKHEFLPLIKKHKPNLLVCVPSFLSEMDGNNVKVLRNENLSYIETILQGGESFPSDLDRRVDHFLETHGSQATSRLGFGQNEEFGGFVFNLHNSIKDKRYGSCGIPLPGNEVTIYDLENGKELKYGRDNDGNYSVGALLVTGATLMKGYCGKDQHLNSEKFYSVNGRRYFDTGDQAYLDDDGCLYWVTRDCRIIRTQDGKIFVNVLENILYSLPEVHECCVVAIPDQDVVKKASCHIVLDSELQALSSDEIDLVMDKIVQTVDTEANKMYSYYVPKCYEFRFESLPYTSFGKVAFTELEAENEIFSKNSIIPRVRLRETYHG